MASKEIDTRLFDKAVIFAVKAHSCVERKGHGTPYCLHVFEAASICETMTSDMDILASAVLHDVVEDTPTTVEDIRKEFGDRIATLVDNETEVCIEGKSKVDTWKERKQSIINRLKSAKLDTKIVALGDKLSNIRAISRDYDKRGEKIWDIFHNSDPKEIKWYYTGLVDALSELEKYSAYQEFKKTVEKVFANI